MLDSRVVGFADVVPPNCCHPFLLEALLFQWPSIRRCASRTMVEHKTPEANKSVVPLACPWISVSCPYAWSMPLLARASLNVGCSTPYAACAGDSGGRRTGLPRQTVMKCCQVRACYHGGRPEWPQPSNRAGSARTLFAALESSRSRRVIDRLTRAGMQFPWPARDAYTVQHAHQRSVVVSCSSGKMARRCESILNNSIEVQGWESMS